MRAPAWRVDASPEVVYGVEQPRGQLIDPINNYSCSKVVREQWESSPLELEQEPLRHHLLSIVAADSAHTTQLRVISNVVSLTAVRWMVADWAVVLLDGGEAEWSEARHLVHGLRARLGVCNARMPGDRTMHVKLTLQLNFLQEMLERSYSALFLLDADIAWSRASAVEFFERWLHDFGARPPLVAQGLIRGDSYYWPLSYETWADAWQRNATLRSVRGVRVGFTEQQCLLFDIHFFVWLMQHGGLELAIRQQAHHNQYGLTSIACGAASEYSSELLRGERMPCVLVTTPYDHFSSRLLNKDGAYQNGAKAVERFAKSRYARWWAVEERRTWKNEPYTERWRARVWADLLANATMGRANSSSSFGSACC